MMQFLVQNDFCFKKYIKLKFKKSINLYTEIVQKKVIK